MKDQIIDAEVPLVELILVAKLKHIEGYSKKRALYLANKIQKEKVWNKPLCVDKNNFLIMDGQHRMEAAKLLGLKYVPCWLLNYADVEIWSLRSQYEFDTHIVVSRALLDQPYPYKTVKHKFPKNIPRINIPLQELQSNNAKTKNLPKRYLCV